MSFMISESISDFKPMYARNISAYEIPKGTFYGATIILNKIIKSNGLLSWDWFHAPSQICYFVKNQRRNLIFILNRVYRTSHKT
jgi:hypothetical protein